MTTSQASLDEIDEIMNEIEQLQQSMNGAQAAPVTPAAATPKLKAVPTAAPEQVVQAPALEAVQALEAQPEQTVSDAGADGSADVGSMDEFRGSGGDVSMEETLANLKDDEPSGPNLIDQAMEAEAAAQQSGETTESVDSHDDLLDDVEAEALDNAIAREEEALMQDDDMEQEEVVAQEPPRRQKRSASRPEMGEQAGVAMRLTGDMMLRLSYEFEGQEVRISFTDGALKVELNDGTEFKIPVRRNSLRKAA